MVLILAININVDFNACGILASSNLPNTEMIEYSGVKQTQSPSKKGIHL